MIDVSSPRRKLRAEQKMAAYDRFPKAVRAAVANADKPVDVFWLSSMQLGGFSERELLSLIRGQKNV